MPMGMDRIGFFASSPTKDKRKLLLKKSKKFVVTVVIYQRLMFFFPFVTIINVFTPTFIFGIFIITFYRVTSSYFTAAFL